MFRVAATEKAGSGLGYLQHRPGCQAYSISAIPVSGLARGISPLFHEQLPPSAYHSSGLSAWKCPRSRLVTSLGPFHVYPPAKCLFCSQPRRYLLPDTRRDTVHVSNEGRGSKRAMHLAYPNSASF
jgi:hypothetical protein